MLENILGYGTLSIIFGWGVFKVIRLRPQVEILKLLKAFVLFVLITILMGTVCGLVLAFNGEDFTSTPKVADTKVEAPKKELTPEEKQTQDFLAWKDAQFSVWDGSCPPLIKLVKDNMNNPKSFKHYKTQFRVDMLKGVEVEMEYGGTNAFGGMVRNTVRGYIDYNTKTIKITHINGEKVN